jgi:hypothetical protein
MINNFRDILSLFIKKNYSFLLITIIIALSLCNFLLIHKYNIFVGDDGILGPIFTGKYFENKQFSIVCEEIDFHKLYYIVVGYVYFFYFNIITILINSFNLEFRWINIGSYILFILSVFFFYKTFNSNKKIFIMIIMLSLEPFLVLSHSIRHDVLIFLGNSIILYCISIKDSKNKKFFELLAILLLTTHPSGAPLFLAYLIYLLLFKQIQKIILLSITSIIIVFISSYIKGLISLETINYLLINPTSNLISTSNIFNDLFDYFYNSKYKRHLLELSLFFLYLITIFEFKFFSKKLKILFFFPLIYIFGYIVVLGYFNVSYLKFIYYFFLVYFSLYFMEIKNKYSETIIYSLSFSFLVLFFGIFIVFINHNHWAIAENNISKIKSKIDKNSLIAAPLYYSYLDPEINNNYLPINQIDLPGKDICFSKYQKQNKKLDYVLADTNNLNHPYYSKKIKNYLSNYELIEKIHIGRLGTKNLDKNGYLFLYKLR